MKYSLECIVDSTMKLPPNLKADWDGKTVLFLPNEDAIFAKIKITADVTHPSTCRTWYLHEQPHNSLRIQISKDHKLHEELLADIQALESGLSCQCPVSRIRWHSAKMQFIPETAEEREQIKVNDFHIVPGVDQPEEMSDFDSQKFLAGVHIADRCRDLVGPLSFLREGKNCLKEFRNIQAFFNFYFVLEGLYGDGQYEQKKIKPKFLHSKVLSSAIELEIRRGFPRPFQGSNQNIETMLQRMNKPATVEGLVHLLVCTRGDLHHFLNPKRRAGTPLTDDQYECLARLTGSITMTALSQEIQKRLPPSV